MSRAAPTSNCRLMPCVLMWSTSQRITTYGPISWPLQELPEDLHSLCVSVIKIQHTVGDQVIGTKIPLKDVQMQRLEDYGIPSLDFLSIFAAIFLSWDQGSILAFIHAEYEVDVATKSALEVKIHNFHNKVLLNQTCDYWKFLSGIHFCSIELWIFLERGFHSCTVNNSLNLQPKLHPFMVHNSKLLHIFVMKLTNIKILTDWL